MTMNTNTATIDLTAADAVTALAAATAAPSEAIATYTDAQQCALVAAGNTSLRTIVQHWRNPSRTVAVNIPNAPFAAAAATVPPAYLPIITAVLEASAKRILKRTIENYNTLPTALSSKLFTNDAIMEEAINGNSEWLTKEELTKAWETSATRQRYIADPRYTGNKEFRQAVNYLADLYLKLAGKTSTYKPTELDVMLAKLDDTDMATEFGSFVLRRIEAIKNKPAASQEISLDLL